jgi:hypothetical protein
MADDLIGELLDAVHTAGEGEAEEHGKEAPKPKRTKKDLEPPADETPGPPPAEGAAGPKKVKKGKVSAEVELLRAKIRSYQESARLGKVLEEAAFDFKRALKLKTEEELTAELQHIANLLRRRGNNDLFDLMVETALLSAEAMTTGTRLKLSGLKDRCLADEYWLFTLERAKLEHGLGSILPNVDPLIELTMLTGHMALQVHKTNALAAMSAPVSPAVLNAVLGTAPATGPPKAEAPKAADGPQAAEPPKPEPAAHAALLDSRSADNVLPAGSPVAL